MIRIQKEDFDLGSIVAELRQQVAGRAGAMVTFTGHVRDFAPDQPTRSLYLEHYPGMCEAELAGIIAEAKARWSIQACSIVHRVGELLLGDQIVLVAVASAHRGDAFSACEYLMDALKTRAPFWKRETRADGSRFWVQARESDAERTQRWETGARA